MRYFCFFILIFAVFTIRADEQDIARDLGIVDYWNRQLARRLPVTYNYLLQGGYFATPSARMGQEGEVGAGIAFVPPYRTYSLRAQISERLEATGNYRIFKGVADPVLTPHGFGDMSDKGANLKFSLFSPEDSEYLLPGVAVGLEDFLGTKRFHSLYIALTKVFIDSDCEITLGYGSSRLSGFFAGFSWFPLKRYHHPLLENISFAAEIDPTRYEDPSIEPHPKGRVKKTSLNAGVKYSIGEHLDFSASYLRGTEWAFTASASCNLGMTKGFLPKIKDPLPYRAPINIQPIGELRPEEIVFSDLVFAMKAQGLELLQGRFFKDCQGKTRLWLNITNLRYHTESQVRCRLNHLLAALVPVDVEYVTVAVTTFFGLPIQEYRFFMPYARAFANNKMSGFELATLTPLHEAHPAPEAEGALYKKRKDQFNIELFPKTHTFFGSAKGKFKYALGLTLGFNGFLFDDLYYSVYLGYIFFSNLDDLAPFDRLNPSQLPNVRTDIVRYYQQKGLTVDEAYLQKSFNLGRGFYARFAAGLFEEAYGGLAFESLYYPVDSKLAIGIEGAFIKKRSYSGIGFTSRVPCFDGQVPSTCKFEESQYFLDFYYDICPLELDFKVMAGKFLAGDFGSRFELTRYFPSGLRMSVWYTVTNGNDKINGQTYHDKGIAFSMPLDIFYLHTERSRWNYGIAAWLRDVGVSSFTGHKLYNMIREERFVEPLRKFDQ